MAGRDERPIVDRKLEWEADHAGVIHLRKHPGETQILEGYGTENFGVSPFVPKNRGFPLANLFATGLLASGGYYAWKYRDRIATELRTIGDYALLWRESIRAAG